MTQEGAWRPGGSVDGWLVQAHLGKGGMGEVFRAAHQATGATRALKVLPAGASTEEALRFQREGEAQARVDEHPHVARVHGVGRAEGRPYLVVELCEGGSLEDLLARGPLGWRAAAELARDLAGGLAHLHAHGVVHRDLKPANVLFDGSGRAKVADFGLARVHGAPALTATHALVGTPAFMAPEQARGQAVGAPADVHALGLLLLACLGGGSPFAGPNLPATLLAVMERTPPRASHLDPAAPPALDRLVATCTAKDPARRPSARELAVALDALLAGGSRGRTAPLAALALLLAGLSALAAWGARRAPPPPPPPPPPPGTAAPAPAPPPAPPGPAAPQAATWDGLGARLEALRPRRFRVSDGPGKDPLVALAADGSRAATAVDNVVSIFDLAGDGERPVARFAGKRAFQDLEWTGARLVALERSTREWTPDGGVVERRTRVRRVAFDGAVRVEASWDEETPGRDVGDVTCEGRTLLRQRSCVALAARAGRAAIACTDSNGLDNSLYVVPLAGPPPTPEHVGPPLRMHAVHELLWLDDARLAYGTLHGHVRVVEPSSGRVVELVTPGLTWGSFAEVERVAMPGRIAGLAGGGDVLLAGSATADGGAWELCAWALSRPGAPQVRLRRSRERLVALAGDLRRIACLVEVGPERAPALELLVFDLPPWPE